MPYMAEISRSNPSCFLFLIDQSGSMADPFGGSESTKTKADGVADAMNALLTELTIRCSKEEGIYDYFNVGVIGYGSTVGPALAGVLSNRELVSISDIGNNPVRLEERIKKEDDGAGGIVERKIKFPVWFEPTANAGTPMCQAFTQAQSVLESFLTQHPNCFPPIVINITDGEATDGDPTNQAESLKLLNSTDGNVLLFNLHLSSLSGSPTIFPDSESELVDEFGRRLFRMSSYLTEHMRTIAQQKGYTVGTQARGFVYNADIVSVVDFLDIGTRPSNLR